MHDGRSLGSATMLFCVCQEMIVDIAHHTKKLYTLIELSSTQNMAFPPEKEKNIILRESILVKSASTSSVKGLLGQKFDLKLRHIELVDWNQSTFLLIYKQKSGSLVPLLSIRLVPPLSIASGQADGFFQLFPTGGDDIVLNFTNRDSRDKWLDGIKTASSALKIAENPKGDIGVPESKGDDNNSVVSTSSAPNTTIPQLVMALKPNWENKSDNASIGQMGSSIYNEVSLPAVVRDRNHGLSRSLTIGGEHEPSARRRTKDTPAVDSMLAANKEPLIPQPTVPPRPEPHLSPIFNPHATPLYVVTHTNASMHLEELSEIDPLELVDEDPTPTIGSSTPGFVHKVVEKIEKKVHKTSHPPPDQPLGQDRQLTGETMSKIHQTVETVLIANSSETAGALKANEEDDQNLPAAPTETPLSTSPTPTSKMQLVDEVLSSPQSNLMRFLSSPMQPENAELLQTEVQALTLMNDQLNEALEASETMHRHEMETLYAEMLRLQAHLREVEQEKEFFISTNTEAMAQVFQMQTIQSEKDQVMVEYAELQVKYDTLLEQHNQAATVTQRLVSDQQECLDKVKVLEETLLRKDEELLAVNKKFISTSESLMQKTEELLAREQDSTNKLHELAEVGTENNILYEKVRVLEEVEVKYVGLQQELQSKCERIVTLEAELQQCKISIKSFQANEEAHFVTIARLESLIKEQQSFASELSTQLQIERKRKEELADMQVQHISLLEELHKVKGEKGEMDRDLARQKSAFSSLEKEIDRVKDEYEEKINKKNVEIQTKRKELEMHVMDMEHLKSELSVVQKRFDLVKDQSTKEISEFEIQLTRLRSENKDLSDQLAALKITLSSSHEVQHAQVLQTQATEAQQRQTIRDLEQRVRELDEMHNQIKELALQHGSNVVVLEQENVELQQQLSVEKSKCVGTNWKLQVKEQQHQAEKKALLEQLTDLHSKVEETNRMLLQKDTEMEDLQFTVASLQGKIDQSAKELEQIMLKHDHEAKRVQLQLDNLRQEKLQEIKAVEEHLTQVTRAKDALEMSYSELNAQYQKYKADNYTIEHEQAGQLFDLQSKHVALFSEHDKLQNEYHALQQTVARTVDENTKLTVELSKLNEERIRIVLERDELSAKYSTFSEERSLAEKTLQESIETKETQLSRMTTAYQELENTTNDQIKILKRRVESLEETLLHSNELTKKAQDEKRIVEVALAEKQKAHDMLLVAVGQFESKLEDSQYQLSRVSLQCTKQQTRLKELEENMDKRSETEKSVYEAKLKLQEELGIALEEVRLLEAKCAERDSQLASTVDKLNDVEREHKALTRGLQEKHEELNEARTSVLKVEKLLQDCREDWQLGVDKYESKIQHLTSSLVISQESSRTEKLLLEEQIAEKEAQVAKLETEVSFLQTTCLSLEQTNKRNQERFSSMIEGDLVHQELTRYQSELDGQRQAFDTLYAKYMSLQKQHAQCEEEKVTYSAALDNLFALLVEYYAQPDLTNKSKLECSLSEYVSGIERSVEHLYGHYTSLSSFLNALLPLLSSYDSDGIPVYDSSLPLDTSAPAVVDQLQFIISSIERLDDGSFDNYSMSQALFDNVLALLKSLFLSIQTAQYLRTDFASVREVLQVTQRTATSLASEKKLLEEKVLALENNITVQLKEMNSLTESLQASHNTKIATLLEEGRIEELQRKEFISSLKASIQQHVEKHQLDAFTVAGLQDDIKLLESQWDQTKDELSNVRGQLQILQLKYASDTKELSQQLKAVEYSKEDLAVQNMQKENAIILNIEQRTQLEQQMQSMQASYKETMERHITSIGELKKEVGMLQQINIDMEMKLRLQEQELRQSVDSQNMLTEKLQLLGQHYKTRLDNARTDIQDLERKLDKANGVISQKENEAAALHDEAQEHMQQLRALQTLYDDLQEKHTQQARSHDQTLASYNSKLQSLSRVQQERESFIQSELSALQLQLQEHLYEIDKLQMQVQQKEKEIQQYKDEKADAVKQYEEFTQCRLEKDKKLTQTQLESQQQMHSLSTQLALLQHSLTSKEQEILFLQQNMENLQAEMEKVNADFYGREEKLVEETYKLKLENKEYAYQLDKLHHMNDLLEESVKEKDGTLHSWQIDYAKLDEQFKSCEKVKGQFEKELKEFKAKYENTLRELQQREKEAAKLAQDKASLEEQVVDLRKHLLEQEEALSRDLMQLQSEHRSLQAAHDKLTLSGTSKDRECVRLKEEKAVLEKEYSLMINKLRDQDEESQKILSSLSLEYQELKVKCEKLQGLLQQKEQDAIKLNVERSALTKQLEALQIESRELKEGYEKNENALQLNLAECAKKIDKLQVGNQQKEKELASLTEEKNALKVEFDTCSRRLHNLELSSQSDLVSLKITCQGLTNELSNLQETLVSREAELQHLAQEKQVLAKEYATNIADFREKLQTVQQHAVATADKLARLQQQHDLIQIDYTKAQQDGDYLRDKLAQQERKIVKLQADCEEKQRVLVQETRAFQEQKQEWTELNNKQHLAIERKEQELINLRSDLQTSKVQLREKSERLADLSNTHQIVELSLARTTREKQEAEKLLRKSLQNLRFSQPAAVLNSSRGAEESDLTRSFQKEEAEVVNASRRSQSRTLEDAMHQRIARSLSTFNPASSGEPTKRFQSPSPALGKKLGVRDLL